LYAFAVQHVVQQIHSKLKQAEFGHLPILISLRRFNDKDEKQAPKQQNFYKLNYSQVTATQPSNVRLFCL